MDGEGLLNGLGFGEVAITWGDSKTSVFVHMQADSNTVENNAIHLMV